MSDAVSIAVDTPSRSYQVTVGSGVLGRLGRLARAACGGQRACVVSDSNVAPLYAEAALGSLRAAGYEAGLLTFPAGEASKNVRTLSALLEGIAGLGLTRDDVVVALGGGVTGDMAGLAAALYLRGCQVVQVPTSLLAMVDSSVGGKTAIDLEAGKNLAGAFLQPSLVLADVDCLKSLSAGLLRDSCGEVVKHAVLDGPQMLRDLTEHPANESLKPGRMTALVARNVRIKRDVVADDERERGLRQTLNLGHTIGHAIEAASGFALGHGSSVAAGLCCMARACERKGWSEQGLAALVEGAVRAHGLPTGTDVPTDDLMRFAAHDKKRHADSVNVVVPLAPGKVEVRAVGLDGLRELIELGCGRD